MLNKVENKDKLLDAETEFKLFYLRLNFENMQDRIKKASDMIELGIDDLNDLNQNAAIGALSGLEQILDDLKAVYKTTLIVHHQK